jgi:hypothetical protein
MIGPEATSTIQWMRAGRVTRLASWLIVLSLLGLGCDQFNPEIVGQQRASGVTRLSNNSFGLLI